MKYTYNNEEEKEAISYMLESYSNQNSIAKKMYENFFGKIQCLLLGTQGKVLEIGCGLGESSLKIQQMIPDAKFEVSEYNQTYVNILKNNSFPITIRQESIYDLQRDDNEFETVLLLEVLEHLEDYELALQEISRIAKKQVIVSVPNEPIWCILNILRLKYLKSFGNTPGHINHWTSYGLKKLLKKYGKIQEIYTPLPWTIISIEPYKDEI